MPSTDQPGRARRVARAVAYVLLGALAVTYPVVVFVEAAPASPATNRLRPVTNQLVDPLLSQRWTLFAPDAPETNVTTYYQVRLRGRARPDGQAVDLSAAVIGAARAHRWAPTRMERAVTNTARGLNHYAVLRRLVAARQQESEPFPLPSATPTPAPSLSPDEYTQDDLALALTEIDAHLAIGHEQLVRLVSAVAFAKYGDAIEEIRAYVTSRPITRFSQRYAPAAEAPDALAYDTGWVAPERGIGT